MIELKTFAKRSLSPEDHQELHEFVISEVLTRAWGKPHFMGFVSKGHRLEGRDHEHLHPRAPIYRITHPKLGLMDIASRQHHNYTRITATYANHGLRKRQSFQHQRLSDHLFEGVFSEAAAEADPLDPQFDAAGGYQQIEDSIKCFTEDWRGTSVLNMQLFDTISHATFAFGSLGIYQNGDMDPFLPGLIKPDGEVLPQACIS